MAPGTVPIVVKSVSTSTNNGPLKASGSLAAHEYFDVTPVIGREFPKANLVELLEAPNSDELIRDLAITSKSSPMGPLTSKTHQHSRHRVLSISSFYKN